VACGRLADRHEDAGLVDMVSDSARVHMRRIVNRMMTGEAAGG
jgi:hypothetical protein